MWEDNGEVYQSSEEENILNVKSYILKVTLELLIPDNIRQNGILGKTNFYNEKIIFSIE